MVNSSFVSTLGLKKIPELATELGEILSLQHKYVTCVESCTGGGIAYAITDVAGSSAWFEQSWVTYSNQAKSSLVGVKPSTLEQYGAVSEAVVTEMALGALHKADADISIAVSGIAGPAGGTSEKPVGLVWFAIAQSSQIDTFSRRFSGSRSQVREQAVSVGLQKLIASLVTHL